MDQLAAFLLPWRFPSAIDLGRSLCVNQVLSIWANYRKFCVNSAMSFRKRQKTGRMTRVILLVSFIILLGRLIYVVPGAIEHHQQKKNAPAIPTTVVNDK
ncbi:YfgG family protein [Pseudomonas cerasi]